MSPSRFFDSDFFAKTTGTPKYCAVMHAMPMPDASTVSIFVTFSSLKSLANSLPISFISDMFHLVIQEAVDLHDPAFLYDSVLKYSVLE